MKARDIVFCGLFAALMVVGAYIKIVIPIGVFTVTFSLQLFFAILAGFLLGSKKGLLSVGSYILLGLLGAPVFAHGGGIWYMAKPTFGFILGFAAAAWVVGFVTETFDTVSAGRLLFAAFLGEMAFYACGLIYYYITFNYLLADSAGIGIVELFSVWFLSTVMPDFLLCLLASRMALRLRGFFVGSLEGRV